MWVLSVVSPDNARQLWNWLFSPILQFTTSDQKALSVLHLGEQDQGTKFSEAGPTYEKALKCKSASCIQGAGGSEYFELQGNK